MKKSSARGGAPCRPDLETLEKCYADYNKRELAWPDPVTCIYPFDDPRDREIAGLVASTLAFGRVSQIHRSVEDALGRMGPPYRFAREKGRTAALDAFDGFRHRWVSGRDLAGLLAGLKELLAEYGCLEGAFRSGVSPGDTTVMPAVAALCRKLAASDGGGPGRLVPSGEGKCAFKRLNLFLRWMVRRDEIDPGGWDSIPASRLVVPLDTHMFRVGRSFGFTTRKSADGRTALEVTAGFAGFAPDDPVKYDFALARMGMTGLFAFHGE